MTTEEALCSFLIISQWLSLTPTDDDNLVSVRGSEGGRRGWVPESETRHGMCQCKLSSNTSSAGSCYLP